MFYFDKPLYCAVEHFKECLLGVSKCFFHDGIGALLQLDVDETDHPEKKKTSLRNFPSIFFRLLKKKIGTQKRAASVKTRKPTGLKELVLDSTQPEKASSSSKKKHNYKSHAETRVGLHLLRKGESLEPR